MTQNLPATADELEPRYAFIAGLLINEGLAQNEIVRRCLDEHPEWGVQRRQIYNYIGKVWAQMSTEALGVDRQAYYYLSIRQLDVQIGKAMRDNNQKAFNALLNTRLKLMNISPSQEYRDDALKAGVNIEEIQRKLLAATQTDLEGITDE